MALLTLSVEYSSVSHDVKNLRNANNLNYITKIAVAVWRPQNVQEPRT